MARFARSNNDLTHQFMCNQAILTAAIVIAGQFGSSAAQDYWFDRQSPLNRNANMKASGMTAWLKRALVELEAR